jgi:Putative metallopeptidase
MKHMRVGAFIMVLAGSLIVCCSAGLAQIQIPPELRGGNVKVDYLEPRDPGAGNTKDYANYKRYQAIYDRMKKREVLEEYAAFLSPLRLPVALRVRTQECGVSNAFYEPSEWTIKYCYEYLDEVEAIAPKTATAGFSREEVIVGEFLMTLLHETGHAMNDIFKLPVLGREEDAADDMAAFVSLQFGPQVARTAIKGDVFYWFTAAQRGPSPRWDEHSTSAQRLANMLCIGYGGAPDTFKDMIEKNWLPKDRIPTCARQYQRLRLAFRKTMLPHIDPDLLKKVQSITWLAPGDGKW